MKKWFLKKEITDTAIITDRKEKTTKKLLSKQLKSIIIFAIYT